MAPVVNVVLGVERSLELKIFPLIEQSRCLAIKFFLSRFVVVGVVSDTLFDGKRSSPVSRVVVHP